MVLFVQCSGEELLSCKDALVVSDLHCRRGSRCVHLDSLITYARRKGVDCVVIAGDLFDDFHQRASPSLFLSELNKICDVARLPRKTMIVLSGSSHDPKLGSFLAYLRGGKTLLVTRQILVVKTPPAKLVVLHGDLIVKSGALAFIINYFAKLCGRELLLEENFKRKIQLNEGLLVVGHTHVVGADFEKGVVNLGSWKRHWFRNIPYWRRTKPGVLLVDEKGLKFQVINYV
ncbi:MAG: metallophosphoesterase family protein [Thermofilum sp.]|jgi:predicted phosphodiesterase|nr:metallophosphoesterase family protein [Thermofilum sp.]